MFQSHSSDESLIAWLDGETPFYRRALVRSHLAVCWKCRLRLSRIEEQILDVTRAVKEDTFPGAQRTVSARLRFLEQASFPGTPAGRARPAWGRRLGWVAACLVLIAGGLWVSRRPAAAPVPVAGQLMRQAERAEAALMQGAVQQEFRVLARQLEPREISIESRLEVWSDPGQDKFASRLSRSGGALCHALWRPSSDRSFVYNPARHDAVVRLRREEAHIRWPDLLLREGLTLEALEASLMTWLENRPWRPVTLSSGLALAAAGEDESLQVETARSAAGDQFVRLSAWKRSGAVAVGFILEVEPRTSLPRLQRIRYESTSRTLELWIIPEPVQAPRPAVYEPPPAVRAAWPPPLPLHPEPPESRIPPAPPAVVDAALAEIEIHYALHRIGACLGEAVEVVRQPGGGLEVRGVVVDAPRKQQVLAALAGTAAVVDIKSVEEAVGSLGHNTLRVSRARPASARPRKDTLAPLYDYFSRDEAALDRFAGNALSRGQDLIFEAQALRRLAGAFLSRGEPSSTRARRLLEVMMYDHLRDLQAKLEDAWQSIKPPLAAASGPGFVPAAETGYSTARTAAEEAEEIFRLSRLLNERLEALFESGDRPARDLTRDVLNAFLTLQHALSAASARALTAEAARD